MTTLDQLSDDWGQLPLDVKELVLSFVRHPCAAMIPRARKIYCAKRHRICWVELEHPELHRLVHLYNRALDLRRAFDRERSLLVYTAIAAAICHWHDACEDLELTPAQEAYAQRMRTRLHWLERWAHHDLPRSRSEGINDL